MVGIGVWKHVDLSRTRPIEEMQVWDGISSARITFEAPFATPSSTPSSTVTSLFPAIEPMATLVENIHLQRAIMAEVTLQNQNGTKGGVEVLDGTKVVSIKEGEGGWPVVTIAGVDGTPARHLRARLLVSRSRSLILAWKRLN